MPHSPVMRLQRNQQGNRLMLNSSGTIDQATNRPPPYQGKPAPLAPERQALYQAECEAFARIEQFFGVGPDHPRFDKPEMCESGKRGSRRRSPPITKPGSWRFTPSQPDSTIVVMGSKAAHFTVVAEAGCPRSRVLDRNRPEMVVQAMEQSYGTDASE